MRITRPLQPDNNGNPCADADADLRTRLQGLLTALYPRLAVDRRREVRYPYPHQLFLTPVGADGRTPDGEPIAVMGKDLAEHGLSFYHAEPIPHRRMIVSLQAGRGRWVGLLIDLTWCRFKKCGWYESGGRFLEIVASPIQ
jgi:hypothetical protein